MRVLAIDTSGSYQALAVMAGSELRFESTVRVGQRHGETLLGSLEIALREAAIVWPDIELIAVGLGPGSFTGVRIGVSTAKALALARGIPIVGVRTTRVVARAAPGELRVVAIDAHKGELFVAAYRSGERGIEPVLEETNGPPEIVGAKVRAVIGPGRCTIVGDGSRLFEGRFVRAVGEPSSIAPAVFEAPRGAVLALEAVEAYATRGADDLAALEPYYVRASDAVLPSERASDARAPR